MIVGKQGEESLFLVMLGGVREALILGAGNLAHRNLS
jgi:hypothetical protein